MSEDTANRIAIVGLGLRLPGASEVETFWRNLVEGRESIRQFRDDELQDSFDAETRALPNFVRARAILDGIDQFDAEFFGYHAREAALLDPQHRALLECAWEALEDAAIDPARVAGPVGVFSGSSVPTYLLRQVLRDRAAIDRFTSDYQVGSYAELIGNAHEFSATRIAYKLDLKGPAVNLNSACSTALLAIAQACQSLLLYQCDVALAGAASISLPQARGYLHQEGGMASADGHVRSFDADATGTVFGSGAGMVALKRYDDAIADGDPIYAVILGAGLNNDGAGKAGFTAPSVEGQAACIAMAHAVAGVEPRSISYVECHGTATPLGDPIEIAGLTQAFRLGTEDSGFCRIGTAKTNIGHLDAAAGIAGLAKTALMLREKTLPATLHYRRPNPQIDFAATPFVVNAELRHWDADGGPRRAGVSAFGVGGTNVHLVLEEAPEAAARAPEVASAQLLQLSARTPAALDAMGARLAEALARQPELRLDDVAATLAGGRRAFVQRRVIVAGDRTQAIEKLAGRDTRGSVAANAPASPAEVMFLFPGQGSQYPDMGRGLYESEAVFRDAIDRCAAILAPLLGEDLRTLLYPPQRDEAAAQRLMATVLAQPAIFSVEYALAQLWLAAGVQPVAMLGHSVGEFVAATLAGVMELDDALALVAERGRLMQALPGGAMLAVRLPEADVLPLLGESLSLAAINGPALCVLSGPYDAIDAVEKTLAGRGAVSRRLHTSHAFHSAMVEPAVAPLRERAARVPLRAPTIPYVSCVSGGWIADAEATSPDYWARHAREAVRFAPGLLRLIEGRAPVLLEVGAGNALTTLAHAALRGRGIAAFPSLPDAARGTPDREAWLEALGRLWLAGVEATPSAWLAPEARRRHLPTYPFQRSRHWIDAPPVAPAAVSVAPAMTTAAAVPSNAASLFVTPAAIAAAPPAAIEVPAVTTAEDHLATLRASIVAILEDLSGETPPADGGDPSFIEMGYDSLFLTQVAQRLSGQYKLKLTFRQLLGDYSTIGTLAGFLAQQVPPSAAPARPAAAAAAAPVASAVQALPMALPGAAPVVFAAGSGGGFEALFRDQLAAMTALMQQQTAALAALGGGTLPAAAALPLATSVAPAAPAAGPAVAAPTAEPETEQRPSRFAVYKPTGKSSADAFTPEQRAHIDELARAYSARYAKSKARTQQARAVLADPRAANGFRQEWKEMVFPIVCARSKGSKIWDLDGNEFVDVVNGYGQTAFGHTPDFVAEAVKRQLDLGFAIGPQADLAADVAQTFAEMTGNERVTFCNTGSEAVMAAMRVARNITGRSKVVVFNGDYHGQFDEVLVKGVQKSGAAPRSKPVANGIPDESVANMVVLEYGSDASLKWIRDNAEELAAVVIETVQSRHPDFLPVAFLRELRAITEASGTAFVMDEVVTGFRVHPGGMQAVLGIKADLATYGKVVGGGMPIGVLAGKAKFMDGLDGGHWQYGDDSYPETGVTFFAGTFVRHPLVLAAMQATMAFMREHGPALQENLTRRTRALVERLRALFAEFGLKTPIETYASFFYFNLHAEHPLATLLFHHLRLRGIHIQDGFPCFLTTAHSDEDFDRIVQAFRESLAALTAVGVFGAAAASPKPAAAAIASSSSGAQQGLPLTEPQLEVWLAAQRGDELSCAFNESVTLTLSGQLDEAALRGALDAVVARHDALRIRFATTGEHFNVLAAGPAELATQDLRGADAEARLQALLAEDARTPFDLVNAAPWRATLLRLAEDRHALLFTAHHIVCDGWSINVIVSELAELYAATLAGRAPELGPVLAFSDYARRQQARAGGDLARTEAYWLGQFGEPLKPLDLPVDRPRGAQRSVAGASLCRRIDAALYQAVRKAGAKQRVTLFSTLLGAFEVLAGRLGNSEDVVVGVPTAGQSQIEDQVLVGHCVNFLPIRGGWTRETPIAQHLAAVSKQVLDAYEHQDTTFGTIVRQLAARGLVAREANRLPLTEIQFNLERLADRLTLPGLSVDVVPNPKAFVNFDLFLNVIESPEGLRLDCDYNTGLYDEATIVRWLDAYQALLEAFVADAQQPVARSNWLTAAQRRQVIEDWNRSARDYPREQTVHGLFEAQVAKTPEAIAAEFGDTTLSYAALDRRANQFAHALLARGAAGKPVGILAERSLDLLAALLGAMKAGCAYVPLDPRHPAARLKLILGEAGAGALVTDDAALAAEVAPAGTPVLNLGRDALAIAGAAITAPPVRVAPEACCYLIYTSGSTGIPKGVQVGHRAVVNLLLDMAREPGITATDRWLAVTTISFDIAALELYGPLLAGGRVIVAETEEAADGYALAAHLARSGATMLQATPATWRILLEADWTPPRGFRALCGGEPLPRELADRLLATGVELWNMYGPTETTIWSSCSKVAASGPIHVGGPIANTQFYVLDREDQPVPAGVPGQLHIGGDGVAIGYWQRDALNAERFIANPFAGGRMYRTGDLARWLPDGTIQHLGRMDHQTKIRGFRIELGDIESALLRVDGVAEAAAMVRDDGGRQVLVAWWVDAPGRTQTPAGLREALATQLPDYMIPSAWMRLERMPKTPNAKLDRNALPAPSVAAEASIAYVAPATPLEEQLAKIWAEVLHRPRVGTGEDLFSLGADSIQLFQIVARANREGLTLSARQLLQAKTIAATARQLAELAGTGEAAASAGLPSLRQFSRKR